MLTHTNESVRFQIYEMMESYDEDCPDFLDEVFWATMTIWNKVKQC